jgi:tRNA-dihydrouridine synthase A
VLSIAPMIDWTYSHFRVFMRILAPSALLYTEMQTTGAIKNNPQRAISFNQQEEPLVLQLGGSDPTALAECAQIAELQGFTAVNLNLGCPSDKVQAGRFGACLMAEPKLASLCINAMKSAVSIPVTAKVRIGIDKEDSYDFFRQFAVQLIDAGIDALIVHARKAWLTGLNPKQNRTIPPLHYDYVYRLKQEFTQMPVIINGNIVCIDDINSHLAHVDGVMIGRLACQNPYKIAEIHHALYPDVTMTSRSNALKQYVDYAEFALAQGAPVSLLLKPLFNFFHGLPGAKQWKQLLMCVQATENLKQLQGGFF